jgi:hypothetical protein
MDLERKRALAPGDCVRFAGRSAAGRSAVYRGVAAITALQGGPVIHLTNGGLQNVSPSMKLDRYRLSSRAFHVYLDVHDLLRHVTERTTVEKQERYYGIGKLHAYVTRASRNLLVAMLDPVDKLYPVEQMEHPNQPYDPDLDYLCQMFESTTGVTYDSLIR